MSKELFELDPTTGVVRSLRARNRRMGGDQIRTPVAAVPDQELIDCMVGLGMPRRNAQELKRNGTFRLHALRLWVDVGDAAKGDAAARERVDYVRAGIDRLRRADMVSDDPRRGDGNVVDPAVLL